MPSAPVGAGRSGSVQQRDQATAPRGGVPRQAEQLEQGGGAHVTEDVVVVDDLAVSFRHPVDDIGRHPVGPGNGLHQGVVAHRAVEIDRRAGRGIKARQRSDYGRCLVELCVCVKYF